MEIDYFVPKKSSSGKYYYVNTITRETQWGETQWGSKRLPKGWIRLKYNGENVYKFIRDKIPLTSSLAYSPKYLNGPEFEMSLMSYEDLDKEDEKQQAEACRRLILFEKVAKLLKLRTESICDESLQYLAKKANILPQTIIDFIEQTERKQLGKRAILTPFSRIKGNDYFFSSERSIRELCGVNMREAEASKAMAEIEEELSCPIRGTIFKDPFTCSSGHTFERGAIEIWLQTNRTCPKTRIIITNYIVPNYALRNVLEKFVEKYENQKGDIWKPIVKSCLEYKNFSGKLNEPEYVIIQESDSDESGGRTWRSDSDESDNDESDEERETERERHMRIRALEREREENQTEREREENQTGRTAEQIRAYLINLGLDIETIQDIPEIIAGSRDSSYRNAETIARYEES
jgi:hypothetical protein